MVKDTFYYTYTKKNINIITALLNFTKRYRTIVKIKLKKKLVSKNSRNKKNIYIYLCIKYLYKKK